MAPMISINLCCYNSEKLLEETLQSIFTQTYKDWELVVINDGSTDSTEQIIRKHINDGWPIIYHYQSNAGLGASRNKAIELSTGEFIAIIDHDDLWLPSKLEKQMAIFFRSPQVGLVYTEQSILYHYPKGATKLVYNTYPYQRGNILLPLSLTDFITCSSIMVRTEVLNRVGLFNPELKQVEEYDLILRIASEFEIDYVEEPLVSYRLHSSNASKDSARRDNEVQFLIQQAIKRTPFLKEEMGSLVFSLRVHGINLDMGQYYLLKNYWQKAHDWYGSWYALVRQLPQTLWLYWRSKKYRTQISPESVVKR
jgi:glycosyltransferase involved in cell wall biosynthesis